METLQDAIDRIEGSDTGIIGDAKMSVSLRLNIKDFAALEVLASRWGLSRAGAAEYLLSPAIGQAVGIIIEREEEISSDGQSEFLRELAHETRTIEQDIADDFRERRSTRSKEATS